MVTLTLSATLQSISIWSPVSKTTLPPANIFILCPTAIGTSFAKNVVVLVAVRPPPDVVDTNFTDAVTYAV